jgi:mono/diheme cytochrome c family protein
MRNIHLICALAIVGGIAFGSYDVRADDKMAVDFEREVLPIFKSRCFECHGSRAQESGLRLDVRLLALEGGDSGPILISKDSSKSELIHRVTARDQDTQMPPEGTRLSDAQVATLRKWIDQGADWPDDGVKIARRTSDHWSFKAPTRPKLPSVKNTAWVRNPIDRFVLARLEKQGVAPSEPASRRTLLRRLSLDLIGLPPSTTEIADFLKRDSNESSRSFDRSVERLLASQHFGERWARHWLDLARYADSNGYERDDVRPNAWRYRDWVVNAFNSDMSYDQFVIEQMAGDLLPNSTLAQKTATGFHRMTTKNTESGINKEDYRNREVVDRVNTTGSAFLGLTIGCAQCHSHKYDPISQREYYRFYAFFNNIEEVDLKIEGSAEDKADYKFASTAHQAKSKRLKQQQEQFKAIAQTGIDKWRAKKNESPKKLLAELAGLDLSQQLQQAVALEAPKRSKSQADLVAKFVASLESRLDDLKQSIRALSVEERYLPKPVVMTTAEASKNRRQTHVLLRGDFKKKGAEVQSNTLVVLPLLNHLGAKGAKTTAPDRLSLARWIVDKKNPLTARVEVNRIWKHLFGRGLVATLDDFGTQGEKPTHPELLDWLAVEFQQLGWSRKRLIRLIVDSATYQQASRFRPELQTLDPLNSWVARQNRFRVDGEIVRDLYLASSGLLARKVGGKTIRPPAPESIKELSYKYKLVWQVSPKPDRYRRGMYIHLKRSNPFPSLVMFDCPEAAVSAANRNRSNTPLQALTTLNDPVFVECAQALGRRSFLEHTSNITKRIQFAAELCLSRRLNSFELATVKTLFDEEKLAYENDPVAAREFIGEYQIPDSSRKPTESESEKFPVRQSDLAASIAVARVLMNLDEFVTRE